MNPQDFYNEMMGIGGRLKQMFDTAGATSFIYGNVVSVDKDTDTISVRVGSESGDLVISDISLGPDSGASTCVVSYPEVGSLVVIGLPYKQPESAFVARFSGLDSVKIVFNQEAKSGDEDTITANNNEVKVMRGQYSCIISKDSIHLSSRDGASIIIKDDNITMNGGNLGGLIKIDPLVSAINAMVSTFNAHKHASVGAVPDTPMTTLKKDSIEDGLVSH